MKMEYLTDTELENIICQIEETMQSFKLHCRAVCAARLPAASVSIAIVKNLLNISLYLIYNR